MAGKILTVTFPAATNKKALGLTAHMRSRPHGLGTWTTIAAGFIYRVEGAGGANLTGNNALFCGFRNSAAGLPGTNPGHSYFFNLFDNPWTWNAGGYWESVDFAMYRYQNATAALVSGAGTQNTYGATSADNFNAVIVVVSKVNPTTASGLIRLVGATNPETLIQRMTDALNEGSFAGATSTLGGSSTAGTGYTVDEATYGALDEVFAYWNSSAATLDVLWTGVAKWA